MRAGTLILLLAPVCLPAQFRITILDGRDERPVGEVVNLGSLDASDFLDTRFQLRNISNGTTVLQVLSVAGVGFSFTAKPSTPVAVPAAGSLTFTVRFEPKAPGTYSAVLTVNTITVLLRAVAMAGPVVWLGAEGRQMKLSASDAVDFGTVERGAVARRRFVLENPYETALTVSSLEVSGASFRGPEAIQLPLVLAPQDRAAFEVVFAPQSAGAAVGRLTVNGRIFLLTGQGVEPRFPKPEIVLDPAAPQSGQQVKVMVRLASTAPRAGTGELRLRFEPLTPGLSDDPAIQFLSPSGRVVPFSVEEGEQTARIAGRSEVEMQTGTTAGRVILTAQLDSQKEEAVVTLAAMPVAVDSLRVTRNAGAFELNLTAFDNTRSVSQLVFTFYDRQGRAVEPGAIAVDASREFQRYFENSGAGGMFALRAVFPVSGEASAVTGVEVELRNAVGTTRSARASF